MTLTSEQIIDIDKYSALFMKVSEIAVLIDVDADELREEITNRSSIASKTYYRAKYLVITKLRAQEIEQAELGSNTAIELVARYIQEQKLDE